MPKSEWVCIKIGPGCAAIGPRNEIEMESGDAFGKAQGGRTAGGNVEFHQCFQQTALVFGEPDACLGTLPGG